MIYVGIVCIIIGLSAIILKKYPNRNTILRNLQSKYDNVDEKKVIKFQGICFLVAGAINLIGSIFEIKNNKTLYLVFVFIMILGCIIYYPIRRRYLNLK